MQPLLSIVIANYNYGHFLGDAIQSVLSQDMGDQVELIICDGGSSDNSIDVIKKYSNKIAWWCSEKDGGQSMAFNKGFSHAHGRFLTWLNADDILLPGVLKEFEKVVAQYGQCEWFVGGSLWLDPQLRVLKCNPARDFSECRFQCGIVSVWGPSSIFSASLLSDVGYVDERLHYVMDSELWLRFARRGFRYKVFAKYASGLRLHPQAKMSGHNFKESEMSDPNHPKWAMIRREKAMMHEGVRWKKYTLLRKFISANFCALIVGMIDTICYRRKHYLQMFKEASK